MKVELINIGSIKKSTIDLSDNLIVFTGSNNSGKTYVSYILYGLSRFTPTYEEDFLNEIFSSNLDDLFNNSVEEIDLNILIEHLDLIEKEYSKQFQKFLPLLFGMDSDYFLTSEVKLKLGSKEEFRSYLKDYSFQLGGSGHGNSVSVSYKKINEEPKIVLSLTRMISDEVTPENLKNFKKSIKSFILQYTISAFTKHGVSFLPAERIGISVFSKELFLNRFNSSNEILSLDELNRSKVVNLLNKNFNRYSLVIQDSLRNQENLSRNRNREGNAFNLLATELELEILGGKLSIDVNGDVFYEANNQSLKIQSTGSIIKSLASFVFFLRFQAASGQVLIMDEPEINLHPNNQRIISKYLVRLSNMGVKVIISTHSDYIIREINNMIMLNKNTPQTEELMRKFGYRKNETINKNNVGAYFFIDAETRKMEVDDKGFEVEAIDNTISLQNTAMNEIRWTLFEE